MIPVQLIIEGLYSYQERQVIDFSYLTEAGLFGIFGATGSGKSSILEAISYALYGQIERLHSRDKRTYNMMNLKSDRAYVEFDFINFENKKYRASREFKRNRRNFENVSSPTVVFYEWKGAQWLPLEHSDAEKIVGLTYENFKRTIIIPQGQFKEFIDLGATERTQMIKEIFNLQKFDLQDNAAQIRSANRSELDKLEGLLSGFEEINEEILSTFQEKWEAEKKKYVEQERITQIVRKNYQEYLALREESGIYQKNLLALEKQEKEKAGIEQLKLKINQFELVRGSFSELINRRKELSEVIRKVNEQIQIKESEFKGLQEKLLQTQNEQNEIKDYFEHLEHHKQKVLDLENVLKIKKGEQELKEQNERKAKGAGIIEKTEKELFEKEKKVKELAEETELLKKQKLDSNLLLQVSEWYNQFKNLEKQLEEFQKKENGIKENIEIEAGKLKLKNLKVDNFIERFEKENTEIRRKIKERQEHLNHLKLEQKLSEYAGSLHDNEACPLCGSLDHPHVHSGRDVSEELSIIANVIDGLEKNLEKLGEEKNTIQKSLDTQKIYQEQLVGNQQESQACQNQMEAHIRAFRWKDFEPENAEAFEKQKMQSVKLEGIIREKEKEHGGVSEQVNQLRVNVEKYRNGIKEIDAKTIALQASKNIYLGNLKNIEISDFNDRIPEQIETEINELKARNEKVDKGYKELDQKIHQVNNLISAISAELKTNRERLSDVTQKEADLSKQLQAGILAKGFQSLDEVQQILNFNLNVTESRNKIEEFNIQYANLIQKIKEQELKLKDFKDSEEQFKAKETETLEAENALANITKQLTQTEAELTRLKKEYERKKELLKTQTQLQKRQENLNTIYNLLKGSGFVQYVSTIFLRQLCDNANIRFHRMTRNQLSLQLNENNDFEVIDYLNEGHSRSVKTLSGGQSFQVSLSLALALAESVQSHNLSQQNFFFIDEGFGTQDTESVNIVFDTLVQLHKENRIVGIISHVDELKERIPRALQITKDEDKGSRISVI